VAACPAGAQELDLSEWVPEAREDVSDLVGRRIRVVKIESLGARWAHEGVLESVRPGQVFSPEVTRRAMDELLQSGRFAAVEARVTPLGDGVDLRLWVVPRRVVAAIKWLGGAVAEDAAQKALGVRPGGEVTALDDAQLISRVERYYGLRGYRHATARVEFVDTDDPLAVLVLIHVDPGVPTRLDEVRFYLSPDTTALRHRIQSYPAVAGDRADEDVLDRADRDLADRLRQDGYHEAKVLHRLEGTTLEVDVEAGVYTELHVVGNRTFDETRILSAIETETRDDSGDSALLRAVEEFYRARGFLDVEVRLEDRLSQNSAVLHKFIHVRERPRVRVLAREFACLSGERTPEELGAEIDSFLSDSLPGGQLLEAPDPNTIDGALRGVSGRHHQSAHRHERQTEKHRREDTQPSPSRGDAEGDAGDQGCGHRQHAREPDQRTDGRAAATQHGHDGEAQYDNGAEEIPDGHAGTS
jgi:outer membrane protein assembly factor BamA